MVRTHTRGLRLGATRGALLRPVTREAEMQFSLLLKNIFSFLHLFILQ